MAEDEAIFDPSLKKKKKKKKTPFDLDAALAGDNSADPSAQTEENEESQDVQKSDSQKNVDNVTDAVDDLNLDDFSSTKKKKKKKKAFDLSDFDDISKEKSEEGGTPENEDDKADFTEGLDLSLPQKKKKKKKKDIFDETSGANDAVDGNVPVTAADSVWSANCERDYTYDELLHRVFEIMRDKNPEMVAGEKKRFVMKPPQVMRVGTRKSSFYNFAEICKMLHRQPKHVLAFLMAELGTSGSIDGNNQLIIKGRFQQKQIESVLRRYIKEYVTCHTCKSPDTILQKDIRLYFLQCETCGSRCSVASIKSGFQAVTGKRAALRARTT